SDPPSSRSRSSASSIVIGDEIVGQPLDERHPPRRSAQDTGPEPYGNCPNSEPAGTSAQIASDLLMAAHARALYGVGRGMLPRALDVIFQHVLRLIAAIVVVPLAVGAVGYVVDHSVTVEARIWADRPLFTPTFATDRFNSSDSPADIEA